MAEPEPPETESFTAWHPMLVALLEYYLPDGWKLLPEVLLSRLPQRVDIVLLRLVDAVAGPARKLHSVFDHLRPHTLIEHKGPTDDLEPGDALTLLAYAGQYMRLAKVSDPEDVCLMVIADRIPVGFVKQIEKMAGTFEPIGFGLWRGQMAGLLLRGIEARVAYRTGPTEHLLYTFSRAYLSDPEGLLPLDAEEGRVYTLLYQQVEQFRKLRGTMAIRDLDAAQKSYQDVLEDMVKLLPPERRLAGLDRDHRALALALDVLRVLPEEYLRSLSPEVQEQIRQRLRAAGD
jgi:hypothetical protein